MDTVENTFFNIRILPLQAADQCFDLLTFGSASAIIAHGTDDGSTGSVGIDNKRDFAGYSINGIDNIIVLREIKLFRGIRSIKCLIGVDDRVWIDLMDSFGGDIYFIFSDGLSRRVDLGVDIGQTDLVIIDKATVPMPERISASTV